MEAIDREKFAVQNALRTHRTMQLVLRSKTPDVFKNIYLCTFISI